MIKNLKKVFDILEFDKILKMLLGFTSCEGTRLLIQKILPNNKLEEVERMCCETDEALVLITRFESPGFINIMDVKDALKKAEFGVHMNCEMLFNVGNILNQNFLLNIYYKKYELNFKHLKGYFSNLYINKELKNLIFKILVSKDEIANDASSNLKRIRSDIEKQKIKIKNVLYSFIKSGTRNFLQENLPTIREGRHVLAVKSQYAKEIPGIVHDVSDSGATVFLEPSLVINAENELKSLYKQEQEEIEKILKELTLKCLECEKEIKDSYNNILNLDLIFAKAKLAISMKAFKPNIVENGEVSLKQARNPLIQNDIVVPVDVAVGGRFKNLIISGPNTGGKTVILKTVGILTVMIMCGLLIPAAVDSQISIFNNILIAIGDEQSIENSLSTFSAHMKNIIFILKIVDDKTLVLIDELASGTDPEQGAALAIAIVEQICNKKATLLVTTHYSQLKSFAFNDENVRNACFEFDIDNLKPTYKLVIGSAGQSNAFLISKKFGLDEQIVKRAKDFMTQKDLQLDEMLKKLEFSRKRYEKNIILQKKYILELEEERLKVLNEKEKLDREINFKINNAKKEASVIIQNIRSKANVVLDELKKIKQEKDTLKTSNLLSKTKSLIRKNIYGLYDDLDEQKLSDANQTESVQNFEVGDLVLIVDLNKKGKVLEPVDQNENILILIGNIKTRIKIHRLKLFQKKQKQKKTVKINKNFVSKLDRKIQTELDIRGYDVVEGLAVLDRFIDGCVLNNLGVIRIIHGKGTGALKNAVTKHLKKHPNILTRRFGVYGEGEDGVTIATLK